METGVNSIVEDLPSEILETIFSYCTHKDLVRSIQNVCSRWREVAQSTSLWKNLTYSPDSDTNEQVVEMIKMSPKLQNISFKYQYDDKVLQAITDNCAELRMLELTLVDLEMNFIKNLQEKCPKVEHLRIPHPVLTDLEKSEVVGKFSNLKVLLLMRLDDTRFMINLKPIADHCKQLEHLEFVSIDFEMDDLYHFLCMRKDSLRTLGICCCNRTLECVLPALAICELNSLALSMYGYCQTSFEKIEHFGRIKTVKELTITEIHDVELDHLKQIFENKNLAQLTELKLHNSRYFDDDVTEVIVRNCPLLKCLTLVMCHRMTDACLKFIPNLKELNSLGLAGIDGLKDPGLIHLQQVKGLTCLRVAWCLKITKVGLESIAKLSSLQSLILEGQNLAEMPWDLIPHQMKSLRFLRMFQCKNVDLLAIEKLKTELPFLKVSRT